MVDCKNGESYEGKLLACDAFMNLKLGGNDEQNGKQGVIITSAQGVFSRVNQIFIRGNSVKTIQFE